MKVMQAAVDLNSSHELIHESEISVHSESSFRTVFDQVAENADLSPVDKISEAVRIQLMIEALIARVLVILTGLSGSHSTDLCDVLQISDQPKSGRSQPRVINEIAWETDQTTRIHEQESTSFASTGKIETADGRSLSFNLSLELNRNYLSEKSISEGGKLQLLDPLVINFSGKSVELSGKRFAFDLDADGKSESICALGGGCGFLAIDRNNDGSINDGTELFGTRSGNGFSDLAQLDSDANHWLDEADPAYDKLLVWKIDGGKQQSLTHLREAGVGALYLGSTETPFDLTDDENRLLAHIRASGIYLMENGQVGSLQQVDMASDA